ncbi:MULTISPECIES: phospholipase D-like domain-containing protein [Bacillus]|uniref:phospholipase D-like domain-containing protein n=1 Tax=Bacillus TaxID=1386 RepID=UPI001D0D05B0|nr:MULTISPECIES: phospholipase D-like domain-containing protein [Bacillus]
MRQISKRAFITILLLIILVVTGVYHSYKPLPDGISFEGEEQKVEDISFIYDLTYEIDGEKEQEQNIFPRIYEIIEEAEDFIIVDFFLFNAHSRNNNDDAIIKNIVERLIQKKRAEPNMPIVFITDKVNSSYQSHKVVELETLKSEGIEVVETKLRPLRDSNPIYSSVWRVFFQWFGQEGKGWVRNPLNEEGPDVTVRSYLSLLNIKANHRKLVATEKSAIISSANPHEGSANHSNIAIELKGPIIEDVVQSELATMNMSNKPFKFEKKPNLSNEYLDDVTAQLLTEGKILKHVVKEIKETSSGEEIWLGMFYLSERTIINELKNAAERGVTVRIILDPNENAFGQEKIGLPNRPVANELTENTSENLEVRWYNTLKEQYHPKTLFIKKQTKSVLISGSANYTKRNLDDLNLETNVKINAPNSSDIIMEVDDYFNRLWKNEETIFTLPYEEYADDRPLLMRTLYHLQKFFRFTTY